MTRVGNDELLLVDGASFFQLVDDDSELALNYIDTLSMSGALTFAGGLSRAITKVTFAGALTFTGGVAKAITKATFTGALTFVGGLTTVKVALDRFTVWTAKFRATDREEPYRASSDAKRGRA